MSKSSKARKGLQADNSDQGAESQVSLEELRDIIGAAYLANRPSFERTQARVKRKAGFEITRATYDRLRKDLRTLDELLNDRKVDLSKFKVARYRVGVWGKEGDHGQVRAELVPKTAAECVRPAELVKTRIKARASTGAMEILVIPDLHVGYKRVKDKLVPLHDERCLSLYLQIARYFQPDYIVFLGDNLDLPAISKYLTPNDLKYLMQPAIDRLGRFYQEIHAAAPSAEKKVLEGNHDKRIQTQLLLQAPELFGIARAGESEPVMAIPYLLHFERLGFEYIAPYGTPLFLNGLRFEHGSLYGEKGGDTVSKLLKKHRRSVITGHNHKAELGFETIHDENGISHAIAMTCGTGAHIDGRIPGPLEPNQQQAVGVIWKGGFPTVNLIREGQCFVGTTLFTAEEEEA